MTGRESHLLAAVVVMAVVGCSGAAADHESLGDRAYVERRYGEALSEFQLALRQGSSDGALRHKAGMAALNARDLSEAAVQFRTLAEEDADRVLLAADGLERVARAAGIEGNVPALQAAVEALHTVDPGRALGSFARELAAVLGKDASASEAISVLPFAAAAAPDARSQDSLMYEYAVALADLNRCEEGIPVFESLLRRNRVPSVREDATRRATTCALNLGRRKHNAGANDEAEVWYCRAVELGENNYAARVAYLGLGDVWFSRGDYQGARGAYVRAMGGASPADSLYQRARRGLDRIRGLDLFAPPEPSHRRGC
jgi:tetratricopeptide (TPR) repeat protein